MFKKLISKNGQLRQSATNSTLTRPLLAGAMIFRYGPRNKSHRRRQPHFCAILRELARNSTLVRPLLAGAVIFRYGARKKWKQGRRRMETLFWPDLGVLPRSSTPVRPLLPYREVHSVSPLRSGHSNPVQPLLAEIFEVVCYQKKNMFSNEVYSSSPSQPSPRLT